MQLLSLSKAVCALLSMAAPVAAQEIVTTPLDDILRELSETPLGEATSDAPAIEVLSGVGGALRVLDKLSGTVSELDLQSGETAQIGFLSVTLADCRYPADNPAGDAFAFVTVTDRKTSENLFAGWMLASSPALNAMDHPRYDVWALRCITS